MQKNYDDIFIWEIKLNFCIKSVEEREQFEKKGTYAPLTRTCVKNFMTPWSRVSEIGVRVSFYLAKVQEARVVCMERNVLSGWREVSIKNSSRVEKSLLTKQGFKKEALDCHKITSHIR